MQAALAALNEVPITESIVKEDNEIKTKLAKIRYEKIREKEINKASALLDTISDELTIPSRLMKNIDIVPVINTNNKTIRFKIGIDTMYFIKSIVQFNEMISRKSEHSYGKKLTLKHDYEYFTKRGKLIIDLLSNTYTNNDCIPFNSRFIKTLIKMSSNSPIIFDDNEYYYGGEKEYLLEIKNSILSIHNIYQQAHFFIFDDEIYETIGDHLLLVVGKDDKNTKVIYQLIKNDEILLEENKEKFFNLVYPYVKNDIIIEESFKNDTPVFNYVVELYFDYIDGVITYNPKYFLYNEEVTKQVFKNNKISLTRLEKQLTNLGFNQDKQISEPALIYNFVNSSLDDLSKESTIYISETLKHLCDNKTVKFKINVNKTDNSMLNVFLSDLNYSNQELFQIMNAYKHKKKYVLLSNSMINVEESQELQELADLIDDFNLDIKNIDKAVESPIQTIFKLEGKYDTAKVSEDVKKIISSIKDYKNTEINLNKQIKEKLRDYQLNGVLWLKTLMNNHLGGILADDMGIGKTLQAIALIDSMPVEKPILIICPKNIIYNWESEVNKWAPWLNCIVIDGNNEVRMKQYQNISNEKDIYVISYDSVRRDVEKLNDCFSLIILDEAQAIKNPDTERSKEIRKLKSEYRLCLTGTPIENQMLDIWSIFDFLMPGYLYNHDKFMKIIENQQNVELLKVKVSPFILRRTKKEVLKDLPPKIEDVIYVKLEEEQLKLYESQLLKARMEMEDDSTNRIKMLSSLTKLREICVDPRLIYEDYHSESAKTNLLISLIEESIVNNHKLIIFSQFVSYFTLLKDELNNLGYEYYQIDGKTKASARLDMANDFNTNSRVKIFLVSLKAGGVGLNLVGADIVIHLDPWWNQAVIDQASDRAYRIGQKNTVNVYKIVAKGTLEEKIIEMQQRKKDLSSTIVSDNDDDFLSLDAIDYKALLS